MNIVFVPPSSFILSESQLMTQSRCWRLGAGRAVVFFSWLSVLAVLAVWALVFTQSDEWWPATLVMFLPRWVWGVPLAVLGLLALALRPRVLWGLLVGGLVV